MSKAPDYQFEYFEQPIPNSNETVKGIHLYRLSDEMRIATAKNTMVAFGEDPQNQRMRNFLTSDGAVRFLRSLADRDCAVQDGCDGTSKEFLEQAKGYAANIRESGTQPSRIVVPATAAINKFGR